MLRRFDVLLHLPKRLSSADNGKYMFFFGGMVLLNVGWIYLCNACVCQRGLDALFDVFLYL